MARSLRRLAALDLAGLRLARTVGHTPGAERIVGAYSRLGEHAGLWIALGLGGAALGACRRDRKCAARWRRATATVIAANAVNQTLKLAIRRPRPRLPGLPPLTSTPTQLSFPSAHSATSAAAACAFDGLLPRAPLRLAAGVMAGSRVYLGVHYPSDIVAGMALGGLVGRIAKRGRP
jgi:decaprenylphosphoryl-5-phosphoribose phosphatase